MEKYKDIKDKKELTKLISFMIMGDGGVYQNSKKRGNYQFIMNMIIDNIDYINLCNTILQNITTTKLYSIQKEGSRKPQIRIESKFHPFFTIMRERIYTGNYKGIDPHALKLLDFEALSFLYMSDGSCKKDKRANSYAITLNMKRLSYGDLFILKKALKEKLDLEWNIHKQNQYYYLYLRTKDIQKFVKGIKPYITNSFLYKLPNEIPLNINKGDEIV